MKTVLITGGSTGLGAEIARTLATQGYSIVIQYRTHEKEAQSVIQECREKGVTAECLYGDFSSSGSVKLFLDRCHDQFSTISHVVNNASLYLIRSGLTTSMDEWRNLLQTNFFAPLEIIQGLISGITHAQGSIVNVGVAGLGPMRADVYSTAYSLSKQCLWMLTKSLAKELAPKHVRVNLVSPGYLENSIDLPEHQGSLPMGRVGTLEEAASIVAFLLDSENSYVTGQNIEVAGGVRL